MRVFSGSSPKLERIIHEKRYRSIFFLSQLFILVFQYVDAGTFVSLRSAEVNLRVGPGKEYPISWTFTRANTPLMLVSEFKEWKKVRFIDKTEGWIHQSMISSKNTAIVTPEYTILYRQDNESHPTAKVEKNVVVRVLKINLDWVKVEVYKIKGWIKKQDLWGVNEE